MDGRVEYKSDALIAIIIATYSLQEIFMYLQERNKDYYD